MFGDIFRGVSDFVGGILGREHQADMFQQQAALQREFAQSGITWRVADARRAGIHPLAALGSGVTSFSPIQVGGDPLASAIGSMGQGIGRAIDAASTRGERIESAAGGLQLENMKLQNDLLATNIAAAKMRLASQVGPPMPGPLPNLLPGQGDSGVKVKASETESVAPGHPSQAAAVLPDLAWSETMTGLAPVPSKAVKEQIEDIWIPQLMWGIRNNVLPIMGINQNPPNRSPGEGRVWVFHPGLGEYQSVPRDSWWAKMFGRKSEVWR